MEPDDEELYERAPDLHGAIWSRDNEAARKLIEKGDIHRISAPGGESALHVAAQINNLEIARLLLAKSIDTSIIDDTNATARHLAEELRHTEMAAMIKEAEVRQGYDIPRRIPEQIVMGMDEDGRLALGYKWADKGYTGPFVDQVAEWERDRGAIPDESAGAKPQDRGGDESHVRGWSSHMEDRADLRPNPRGDDFQGRYLQTKSGRVRHR